MQKSTNTDFKNPSKCSQPHKFQSSKMLKVGKKALCMVQAIFWRMVKLF